MSYLSGMCGALGSNPRTIKNKIYHRSLSYGKILIMNSAKVGLNTLMVQCLVHKSSLILPCYILCHDIKESNHEFWNWDVFGKLKSDFWGVRKTKKNQEKSLSSISHSNCVQQKQFNISSAKHSLTSRQRKSSLELLTDIFIHLAF